MKKPCAVLMAWVSVLALTALAGCSSSNESATLTTGAAEQSEVSSLVQDCKTAISMFEIETKRLMEAEVAMLPEKELWESVHKGYQAMFARLWPKMSDSDLKSIAREMAHGFEGYLPNDSPNWISFRSICSYE